MRNKPQGKPVRAGSKSMQIDLFAPDLQRLPGKDELTDLFNRLNTEYFDNRLSAAQVRWSTRLRIAGNCRPDTREIRLSAKYHTHFPMEIEHTLLHEMLHLIYPTHNSAFRREAEKLGVSINCREYPGVHPRSRYVYICPGCQTVYYRQKRADISCGKCSGRSYDPQFKLVLQKSPPRDRPPRRKS